MAESGTTLKHQEKSLKNMPEGISANGVAEEWKEVLAGKSSNSCGNSV